MRQATGEASDRLGPLVVCSLPFGEDPPLMVEPAGPELRTLPAFIAWFRARQEVVDGLLARHGAVRLRDFPIGGTADFEALIDHYPMLDQGYVGGSTPREQIGDSRKVFEATQAAPDLHLGLHQEMAYLPRYPGKLAFYCRKAAEEGGETLLGDMRRLTRLMPARIIDQVARRGVRYLRNFRDARIPADAGAPPALRLVHMTWQDAFRTEDPAVVEAACASLGLSRHWEADGSLTTAHAAPGLVTHPRGGDPIWFNVIQSQQGLRRWLGEDWWTARLAAMRAGAGFFPYYVEYADGSEIAAEDIACVSERLDEVTVAPPWRAGDVLLVDNIAAAHGRSPFKGSRDVQTALLA